MIMKQMALKNGNILFIYSLINLIHLCLYSNWRIKFKKFATYHIVPVMKLFILTLNHKGDALIPLFPSNRELLNFPQLMKLLSSLITIKLLIFIDFLIKSKPKSNPIKLMMSSHSPQKNKISYWLKDKTNYHSIKSNIKSMHGVFLD